ncbi:recombinase family protein [Streptomyces sp. NBC_00053]|uniref:recombinase family protein n=1 Tax=unclassified Streptomyces TaxID=2593676 RepID=UPI00225857C0|nr:MULTISPECIES: recombinase family protein [unclassified Streptomyces]MCX5498991.1 recombinase family protein [Streptomyces sp. NBC_00052]MCX5552477.1 recombinase family protein [Streptomyces sp. NBC_00051]
MEEIDLYLRKSIIVREGVEALTFRTQEDRGRDWAARNNYTVRKVWKDNLSAWTDTKRPDFDKALAALRRKEVPALWVYALDRFDRKGAGSVIAILDAGVRLICDYENLDSANPRDRERIVSDAERAKASSDLLSHRVRDTKRGQRRRGEWVGAPPYGLRKDKHGKLHHDKGWDNVLRILIEASEGASPRRIGRGLTLSHEKSPMGGEWGASTVRRIIHNPVYEGWQVVALSREYTWPVAFRDEQGERVRVFADGVEPVPAELVAKARRVHAGHQRGSLGSRSGKATHLLTDLLRCAGCGSRMPTSGRSYVCCGHAMGKMCPAPASAMRVRIEDYVYTRWLDMVSSAGVNDGDPLMVAVAERWAALTAPEETEAAHEALAIVKAAEAAVERLANDRAKGLYDGAMGKHFPRLVAEAEETLANARARHTALSGTGVDLTMFVDASLLEEAWDAADLPMRRDLIRVAIDKITVTQASRRGAPFDGDARCDIEWATPEAA